MFHTTDGSLWVCERHPDNLRGDASAIASRKGSVERIGVLTGVRSGPWLLPRDEVTVVLLSDQSTGKRTIVQRYYLLHWASLYEGLKAALEDDPQRKNKVVQMSLTQGLSGCRVFHKRTPTYIRSYIIDVANDTNSEQSATTFLQVLLSHDVVEAAWMRKKSQFGWTTASESQASLDEKKFSCANGLFPLAVEVVPVVGDQWGVLQGGQDEGSRRQLWAELQGRVVGFLPEDGLYSSESLPPQTPFPHRLSKSVAYVFVAICSVESSRSNVSLSNSDHLSSSLPCPKKVCR